jgi:hypothetical protein
MIAQAPTISTRTARWGRALGVPNWEGLSAELLSNQLVTGTGEAVLIRCPAARIALRCSV